jgi:phage terminase small subunit
MRMRVRGSSTRVIDGSYGVEMTQKQELFIAEYLIDMNATKAAIRAGYSSKTACEQGSRLLANVQVSAAIAQAQAKRFQKLEITAEKVLQELAKLGFFDPRKLFNADGSPKPLHELDDATASAVAGFEVIELFEGTGDQKKSVGIMKKFRLADKGQNLERLGRHLKLFTDKVEHSGKLGLTPEFMDSLLGDD